MKLAAFVLVIGLTPARIVWLHAAHRHVSLHVLRELPTERPRLRGWK